MKSNQSSGLQSFRLLPSHATSFQFLSSPVAPAHAVLEFKTETNPVRVFLDKHQLQDLAKKAAIYATTIRDA